MLEIVDYVFGLVACEGCIVWVCGELCLTSHDGSVVAMWM